MAGTLYVVATPIGNLGDLSPRAAETLRLVAVVAAEDTRQTRKLVDHAGSNARMISCHAHSDRARLDEILGILQVGQDVALTTDAGTPGVSDPGPALVALARAAGIPVLPIPGPSAVATALMASGLPADRYVFLGFPPRKGQERTAWLERIKTETATVVCFEAPGRAADLVTDLAEVAGADRRALLGREMTKRFEEYRSGTLGELVEGLAGGGDLRGEVTLVLEGAAEVVHAPEVDQAAQMAQALIAAGLERSRVAKAVAQVFGLGRNESYRLVAEDR
ncbi:MAG: 16S rRNA (cytidine(1402)-2'-O)-methyltransferase [Gemmatimonadales bacterium]